MCVRAYAFLSVGMFMFAAHANITTNGFVCQSLHNLVAFQQKHSKKSYITLKPFENGQNRNFLEQIFEKYIHFYLNL